VPVTVQFLGFLAFNNYPSEGLISMAAISKHSLKAKRAKMSTPISTLFQRDLAFLSGWKSEIREGMVSGIGY
jgi:hypothetical protein